MKKTLFIVIILFPLTCISQKLKKIKDKESDYPNEIIYHVLKSNKLIKYGPYQVKTWTDKFIMQGFYKNDKRDSIWTYYNMKKEIVQKYDFTNDTIVLWNDYYPDSTIFSLIDNGTEKIVQLERPPLFLGGQGRLSDYILENLKIPDEMFENNYSDNLLIAVTITKEGKIIDQNFISGKYEKLNIALMECYKKIPDTWIPAIYKGNPVDVRFIIPFKLRTKHL